MIEVDISILRNEMEKLGKMLDEFEKRHGMSSGEFRDRFDAGELGDDREFIKWHACKDTYDELGKRCAEMRNRID